MAFLYLYVRHLIHPVTLLSLPLCSSLLPNQFPFHFSCLFYNSLVYLELGYLKDIFS